MKNSKVDRRIRRSKKLLKQSLISLLNEKKFSDITITDLVNRSDLNRSTFYAHFRDKEELLSCMIDELLNGMITSMTHDVSPTSKTSTQYGITQHSSLQLFTYVSENSSFFKTLMNYHHVPNFSYRLSEALYDFYLKKIKEEQDSSNQLNMNHGFFANYIASIIVGFIHHWLVHTENKYNPDYIAKEFNKIFILNTDFSYLQPKRRHMQG
ncbi:TetR/AcrR family transcriptional regulator [Bacillus massiliigorillae]|uniref:TetR/AcrR family transcriptional regulator n=1 Tax=Bacillus massiliigorillae TaxID=1243664 RepID=UPI0003A5651A|nr:TetR/AcrR family transcriptional regulator [Bacillus massiliigorillae]